MTEHQWTLITTWDYNPAFRCSTPGCGFVWKPDKPKPKTTCEDFISFKANQTRPW